MDWQEAIFGPGWVWSMLGMVLVVLSLFGIYRQLQTQSAANAIQRMDLLESRYELPTMLYRRLELMLYLKSHPADMKAFNLAEPILGFLHSILDLEKAGFISQGEVTTRWGTAIMLWWGFLAPCLEVGRQRWPGAYQLEPGVAKIRTDAAKRGWTFPALDPESLPGFLDDAIERLTMKLQQEKAAQSGWIPGLPAVADAG